MLDVSYKNNCIFSVRSMFHILNLQQMLDSPKLLKPAKIHAREYVMPRPWKESIRDAIGGVVDLADMELTPEVAREYLEFADHDLECARAAARFMRGIWKEYRAFSAHIWKDGCCDADIARFMARKTGHGCIGDTMSIDRSIDWTYEAIARAFIDARGANPLVKEFFAYGGRMVFKKFSESLWATVGKGKLGYYGTMVGQLKDICKDFLNAHLPIREYAVCRVFPDVRLDPLMYVNDQYAPLCNVARKLMS